jgi:hypothetical protein
MKDSKTTPFIIILKDWRLILSGLIGVGLLFYPFTSPLGFILLFNAFDLLGYRNVLDNENTTNKFQVASYRIMQIMFQATLIVLLWRFYALKYAIAAVMMHWLGCSDLLFYIIANYSIKIEWTWLTWTPVGVIANIWKKGLNDIDVVLQAIAGIIIYLIIIGIL